VCLAVFSAASSLWTLRRALLVDHRRDTLAGSRAALRSLAPNTCEGTALVCAGAVPCVLPRSAPQLLPYDLSSRTSWPAAGARRLPPRGEVPGYERGPDPGARRGHPFPRGHVLLVRGEQGRPDLHRLLPQVRTLQQAPLGLPAHLLAPRRACRPADHRAAQWLAAPAGHQAAARAPLTLGLRARQRLASARGHHRRVLLLQPRPGHLEE